MHVVGGSPRHPICFLTNGGGVLEAEKARQLSQWLDIKVQPEQVVTLLACFDHTDNVLYQQYLRSWPRHGQPAQDNLLSCWKSRYLLYRIPDMIIDSASFAPSFFGQEDFQLQRAALYIPRPTMQEYLRSTHHSFRFPVWQSVHCYCRSSFPTLRSRRSPTCIPRMSW